MGCGNSKVLLGTSRKGYVGVVQSLVAFSKGGNEDDDGPKMKRLEKQRGPCFSSGVKNRQPPAGSQQLILKDGQQQDKVAKYKDRYDIKALIGRGSFSRVVRAEHRATHQPFAIKMMEVEAPEGREVCASELAVLRRVSHANVIRLVEVFQFPRRVYVVLELATGGELLDRVISRGHFTERDATQAIWMVLAGLGYLHNLGIAHRDLKPENLLYYHPGPDSRLLVTDFGLATFGGAGVGSEVPGADMSEGGDWTGAERSWSLRTTCGTPEYMAPEVLLRRPYSCAVDIWALGVIAYILLSGSMPFEDDSRTRLYRSIVRGQYSFNRDPWPSVSSQAKDFIQRLLALDSAARLTADQAIRHSWVVTMAAGSSMRNLHQSISQNLRRRASRVSSRCPSSAASSSGASSAGLGKLMLSGRKKKNSSGIRAEHLD